MDSIYLHQQTDGPLELGALRTWETILWAAQFSPIAAGALSLRSDVYYDEMDFSNWQACSQTRNTLSHKRRHHRHFCVAQQIPPNLPCQQRILSGASGRGTLHLRRNMKLPRGAQGSARRSSDDIG